MTDDRIIYAGPEGFITAVADGYVVEDDGGPLEGTFRTLVDAHAAIGSTPPEYPDAALEGEEVAPAVEAPATEWCVHCHGWFVDLETHQTPGGMKTASPCPVLFAPRDDFADLQKRTAEMREARG